MVFHKKRLRMSGMIFIFLCFLGLFVMFFFILRGQEKIHGALREELALLRARMQHMEARISGTPMPDLSAMPAQEYRQPAPHLAAQPIAQPAAQPVSSAMSETRPLGMPDPLESLSMDTSSTPPSGGLDLHFDPQQDFRR